MGGVIIQSSEETNRPVLQEFEEAKNPRCLLLIELCKNHLVHKMIALLDPFVPTVRMTVIPRNPSPFQYTWFPMEATNEMNYRTALVFAAFTHTYRFRFFFYEHEPFVQYLVRIYSAEYNYMDDVSEF
jgi:hypothetical protein